MQLSEAQRDTFFEDGFVIIPESSEGVAPGGEVMFYQYDLRS